MPSAKTPRPATKEGDPGPASKAEPGAKKAVRRRRPTKEVRLLALDAARRLFAERGYARTSTKAIAEAAGVTEVLLFRHFQTKAELFRAAVADPFEHLIHTFFEKNAADLELDAMARNFSSELFEVLSSQRGLVLALIADRTFGGQTDEEGLPGLSAYFSKSTDLLTQTYRTLGVEPSTAPELGARLAFGTVVAAALFQDWMFQDVADRSELKRALGDYVMSGLFARFSEG